MFDCIVEPRQTLPCNLSSSHMSSRTCTPQLLPNREIPYRSSHRRRTVAAALPDRTAIKMIKNRASNMQEQRNEMGTIVFLLVQSRFDSAKIVGQFLTSL